MVRRFTPDIVRELTPTQVFVFGTNESGFHGAGAAGLAFRGDAANTWRSDPFFLGAMNAPIGDEARVGRWAVYGVARGLQKGREGLGYGIVTVRRAGLKRSISLDAIASQVAELARLAGLRPDLEFLVTRIGCGLAGYSESEVRQALSSAHAQVAIPPNVLLPRELEIRPDVAV